MTMDRKRWKEIESIYQASLDKAEEQRRVYLDQVCADDADLRSEVEALLAFHESQGAGLEVPALEQVARACRKAASGRLAGQRLGSYEVISLLGKGGMGEVYLARDTRLDRQVALKVLPPEVTQDPERLRRFVREAKAASALNHSNIATIHELGEADGVRYIVMEYVQGEKLSERIAVRADPRVRPRAGAHGGAPLQIETILDISIQVADALDEAHRKGVTHRDIKPANIMLTPRGQVKVLDFGLAKRIHPERPAEETVGSTESQTTPGVIMGTADYMSPEQVLGQEVDHRTDLFSLGVVLHDMTTSRLPFSGTSPTDTLGKILHTQPEAMAHFNPEVPEELERIVRKCLEKDRGLRYQHASEVCTDLKRLKRDMDSGKAAASQEEVPTARPKVKWLALGIGTGLALIALVAGLGFWLLRQGRVSLEAPLVPVPLTSYPGSERYPSFSPDGTQVAFQWQQEGQNYHIWVKQIGVEPPSQLANVAANDWSPAWSPDGQSIAFIRELEPKKWALMLIPQRGGPERQLEAWDVSKMRDKIDGPYLAWTPDSNWLAFPRLEAETNTPRLFLISVTTGEKRRLTTPPDDGTEDTSPAFSPDGGLLVFTREAAEFHSDLYLLRLGKDYKPQGEPKKVDAGSFWNLGVAWTPNGQEIVFSADNGTIHGLWRMDISKPGKPVSLGLPSDRAGAPSISRTGKRLAYSVGRDDANIWRVDLEGPSLKPGKPVPFISSTKTDMIPAYSPDGKRIAFVSDRSGAEEIWICGSDGRNPVQMTSFGGPLVIGPKWSRDGQEIAFYAGPNGNVDIYVCGECR